MYSNKGLLKKYFLIIQIIALHAPVAFASATQKLSYTSQQRSFSLVYSATGLTLFSGETLISVPVSGCSKKMIEDFWMNALGEFKRLNKGSVKPYVQVNKEKRHVPAIDRRARKLADLDRSMLFLQIAERRQCAKKS